MTLIDHVRAIPLLLLLSAVSLTCIADSDPLSERGINPDILDVMVSSLSQDVGYTMLADISIESEGETTRDRALIIYEPGTEYGIDLYMKFEEDGIETMAPRKFRKLLENRMKLQHRLKSMEFTYDPKSILVESQDGDKAVILFRYQKHALPQPVAWMRLLQGRVWVEGDQVKKIELRLDPGRKFWDGGTHYSEMEVTSDFVRVKNGKDLLLSTQNRMTGKYYGGTRLFKWGQEFTLNFNTEALSYVAEDGTVLFGDPPAEAEKIAQMENPETVRAKLDRPFPIWGKEVRKMGFDLPRPWGLSAIYTDMTTNMDFTSFVINGEQESIEAIFDPRGSGIDVGATVGNLRGDLFVLPFLNVMLLAGNADATGSLRIRTTELGQIVGLPPIIQEDIGLDLTMGGIGLATAMGYKNFFAAVTLTYMITLTQGADTDSEALTFLPLVGYQFLDSRTRVMIGAEYLDLANTMEGSIDLGGGEMLDFNIGVEQEAWAWRAGIMKEFGSHWEGMVSYSWGDDRDGWTFMLGYRW